VALARRAMLKPGPFSLQAIIAANHALAPEPKATDWASIAGYYDLLLKVQPTPVVALNRAVAVAERDGAEAGLAIVDQLLASGELANYHLAHSARAELCRRLGRFGAAQQAYGRALELARDPTDQRFLMRRLAELPQS
jgi:RNA polymerase sigma-70 factor (ECF subfamily)